MALCIPKKNIEEVAEIMNDSNSVSRLNKLSKVFGSKETAQEVNLLFEKSLLLKNQNNAFQKFINDIDGVSIEKKQKLRKNFEANRDRKNNLITDEELTSISKDIYDRKHKVDIEPETVQRLAILNKEAGDLKIKKQGTPEGSKARDAYGDKVLEVRDIIEDLINPENKLGFFDFAKQDLRKRKDRISDVKSPVFKILHRISGVDVKNPVFKILQGGLEALDLATSPAIKVFKTAFDTSAFGRQGVGSGLEVPKRYLQDVKDTWKIWKNTFNKQEREAAFRKTESRIISDDLYDEMSEASLEILGKEEEFQGSIATRIGFGIGDVFDASDKTFTSFIQSQRVALYKKFREIEKIRLNNAEPSKDFLKEMARNVNTITGRGTGKTHVGETFLKGSNRIIFSARYTKSGFDAVFSPLNLRLYKSNPQAYKQLANNSYKRFAAIRGLMLITSTFTEVGTEPTASNFGKAKIPGTKNRWVDLTLGMGSIVTLVARLYKQKSTSLSGKTYDLNSGEFGGTDGSTLILRYLQNKTAPGLGVITAPFLKSKDFDGDKPKIFRPKTLKDLFGPISVEELYDAFQSKEFFGALIGVGLDVTGFGVVDYDKFNKK